MIKTLSLRWWLRWRWIFKGVFFIFICVYFGGLNFGGAFLAVGMIWENGIVGVLIFK